VCADTPLVPWPQLDASEHSLLLDTPITAVTQLWTQVRCVHPM
jgi:hypothetical protein